MPKSTEIPLDRPRGVGRRAFLRLSALGVAMTGAPTLTACGLGGGAGEFPNRPIQLIVAYEPGGGTDVGARILQPFLEEALDAEIQIINLPGGGGWVGWNDLVNADPDGYTIGFINTPNFMTGYLDPRLGRTHIGPESFTLIGNQVTDYGAIAVSPTEDRFDDISGFMDHALEHDLIVTSTGVGSDDHFASLQLSDQFGPQFTVLHNEGAADSISDLLGGNVDAVFANVGEVKAQHDAGEIKVIAVM